MAIRVVSFCFYFAARHVPWRQQDWDTYKFVQALKGNELSGYGHVPVDGVLRRLSNQNLDSAIQWYAMFAARALTKKKIGPPFFVVPVPNSGCTVRSGTRPKTLRLAKAVCEQVGGETKVVDCLRWKKDLGSASKEGGPRDPETLYKNLAPIEGLPRGSRVVLVDDVMTSGGHLRACAAKLRQAGATVVIALCGGRTTYSQDQEAFATSEENLEEYEP